MGWSWRFEDRDGLPAASEIGDGQVFPTQTDAETWIGETWRGLADQGVASVSLFEESRLVYGPMALRAAW